jgi:hypothetical protein
MKKLFVFLLIFLSIVACRKKDSNNPESSCSSNDWRYAYIDTSRIKEFCFKVGSYWVYEKESSTDLDSIIVTNTVPGCSPVDCGDAYSGWSLRENWEYYKIIYCSYPSHTYYYDVVQFGMIMRNHFPSDYCPDYWGPYALYSYTDINYPPEGIPQGIDSLRVVNNMFYNIQLAENEHLPEEIYTAYKVGVVKRVVKHYPTDSVWNLIRWKINK